MRAGLALALAAALVACRPAPTVTAPVETDASDASTAVDLAGTTVEAVAGDGQAPKPERTRAALALVERADAGAEAFRSPAEWGAHAIVSKDGLVAARAAGVDAAAVRSPVENGAVFELGSVPLGTHTRRVVVPADAIVVKGSPSRHMYIATRKALAFAGHPPERMPLVALRTNMGCAWSREGTRVIVGTYGEWESKEGGASIGLLVRLPDDVAVERARNLSGTASLAAQATRAASAAAPRMGAWYASTLPTEGWEPVKLSPDPRHLYDLGRGP